MVDRICEDVFDHAGAARITGGGWPGRCGIFRPLSDHTSPCRQPSFSLYLPCGASFPYSSLLWIYL